MIEKISLGNLECCPLWDVGDKIIYILDILGHHVILLDQYEGQDVGYYLGVTSNRIGISEEVTNFVGVCHS